LIIVLVLVIFFVFIFIIIILYENNLFFLSFSLNEINFYLKDTF
jgi:hypothetical protein